MKLPSREQCLAWANETCTAIISMPTSATTVDRFPAPATAQQLQALIHRAYREGAEAMQEEAAGCCSIARGRDSEAIEEAIRNLKVEDV